ncbi:MAG TPA: class F sortase [Ktedonobacteraceae bacterium]|nr:class F sortase [Ktedonobacteraceae bacterium]
MRKLLLYLCLIVLLILGIAAYNYNNHTALQGNASIVPTSLQPVRLQISRLHIDAGIINVGLTPSGQMDAPVSQAINSPYWTNAFWYDQGAAPGQVGNAVIAGHVDRVGGDPALFWSLGTLKTGDPIYVTAVNQKTFTFIVQRVVAYPVTAPGDQVLNEIFGPTNERHLNLITCSGTWTAQGYDQRLVVFTTQVP